MELKETVKDIGEAKEIKVAPDWNEINLGKCRHGILCAMLQAKLSPYDVVHESSLREVINKLAHFSMTGEIENEKS